MPRKSTKKTTEEQQQSQTNGNHVDPGNALQPVEEPQQQHLPLCPQTGMNFGMNGMFRMNQYHWNPHFSLLLTPNFPYHYFSTNMFGFGGFQMGGTNFGAVQPSLFQQNQHLVQHQMKSIFTNYYIQYMMNYNSMMAQNISMQLSQTPFVPALVPEANSKRNHNEDESTIAPEKKRNKKTNKSDESLPIVEMQATEEILVDVVSPDNAYLVSSQPLSTSTQPVERKTNKTAVRPPQEGISMSIEKLLGLNVDDGPAPKKKHTSDTKLTNVSQQHDIIASKSPPNVVDCSTGNDVKAVENKNKPETKLTDVSQQTGSTASTAPSRIAGSSLGNNVKAVGNTQESKISDVCPQNNTVTSKSPPDVVESSSENDAKLVKNTKEQKMDVCQQAGDNGSTSPPDVVESSSENDAKLVENTLESETTVSQQNNINASTSPPHVVESSLGTNVKALENTQEPKPDAPQQNSIPAPAVLIEITFTLEDETELRTLHGQYLKQPRCSRTRELLFEEWAQRIVEGEKDDIKMKKALALSRSIIRSRTQHLKTNSDTNKPTENEIGGVKRKLEADPTGNLALKTARKEQTECTQTNAKAQPNGAINEGNQVPPQEPQVPDDKDSEEKEPIQHAENDDAKNQKL
ncbi:Protein CBG28113 [Caenorhabditis briggsae]|uniref:Protein CBG28113 n=1 Tax=Caenorhabditis briggsae TaxID=6238 RepID=B6IGV2_CAEBR|nr:Protein CBG28113 [Caenorhabditis briggsae]CAR99132.1 Protein CBG28113 [Caenorhabditis briggsae]